MCTWLEKYLARAGLHPKNEVRITDQIIGNLLFGDFCAGNRTTCAFVLTETIYF